VTLPSETRTALAPNLTAFGDTVLSKPILQHIADAEKNPPYLRTWSTWGVRRDELVTSEGWRALQDVGIAEGMVAMGYENEFAENSRVAHFLKYHLWAGSSAWVNCPSLMTDGVARLLAKHIAALDGSATTEQQEQRKVLKAAHARLVSRDPKEAWTTGQWMTERPGGSDVSNTETLATYDPAGRETDVTGVDGSKLGPCGSTDSNGFRRPQTRA